MSKFDSAHDAAGVPRDCQFMGLAASEMGRLASEAAYLTERTMFAGYRTYIVAGALVFVGVMKMMGFDIPEEVWMMLGGIGLGTLRAAVDGK